MSLATLPRVCSFTSPPPDPAWFAHEDELGAGLGGGARNKDSERERGRGRGGIPASGEAGEAAARVARPGGRGHARWRSPRRGSARAGGGIGRWAGGASCGR